MIRGIINWIVVIVRILGAKLVILVGIVAVVAPGFVSPMFGNARLLAFATKDEIA